MGNGFQGSSSVFYPEPTNHKTKRKKAFVTDKTVLFKQYVGGKQLPLSFCPQNGKFHQWSFSLIVHEIMKIWRYVTSSR